MAEQDNSYISSGNKADLVKVIKQYALFLIKKGTSYTKPTSENWTPGDLRPIGYSSEDGATVHPEPGDETEIKGHNGDTVYSETDGGYWTIQCSGIECRKSIAEAYFGVEADEKGGFHVPDATTPLEYSVILAGLDQYGNPVLFLAEKAKVSDRDDMTLVSSDVLQFNCTFKCLKASDGFQFHVWGLLAAEAAKLDGKIAVESVGLDKTTLDVQAGSTGTIKVTVSPSDATDKTVTADSGDKSKAMVAVDGTTVTVNGIAAGSTDVTVTAGQKSAVCRVTVTAASGE